MSQIGTLTTFNASTPAVASQVNANFSEIKTKVNDHCVWDDEASQVITKTITFAPDSGAGFIVSTGGITVTGNSTITGTLTALTGITSSGTAALATVTVSTALTVTAGNLTMSGGQAIGKRVDDGSSGTSKTLDFDTGNIHRVKMTGNCTFTLSNGRTGATYIVELMQDATGSRTATWPASVVWGSGGAPTLTTTASRKDVLLFLYNGVKYIGSVYETGINDGDTA
jgi:hypothetical protein